MKRWNRKKCARNMAKCLGLLMLTASLPELQLAGIGALAWGLK